jgi:hypothetical protein
MEKGELVRLKDEPRNNYIAEEEGSLWVHTGPLSSAKHVGNFKSLTTGRTLAFYCNRFERANQEEGA